MITPDDNERLVLWLNGKQHVHGAWIGLTANPKSPLHDRASWSWLKTDDKPAYSAWEGGYPLRGGERGVLFPDSKAYCQKTCRVVRCNPLLENA